jgi:hypothetical protein
MSEYNTFLKNYKFSPQISSLVVAASNRASKLVARIKGVNIPYFERTDVSRVRYTYT